ncbi:MAG TPA: hypothetical protein VJ810_36960 [Blastocatellia bacterium]|nr:hypothetical protein [Blastocatellia bacterium]
MPIQLPNLDDRLYQDMVAEGLSLVPAQAPEWTNHNPSDPGVTLVELFAYLSEALLYRLNRVTSANQLSFLKLLNGSEWAPLGKKPEELTPEEISQEIPTTIRNLRKLERAVTRQDFEALALEASTDAARAACLPRYNLESSLTGGREGHVSVIVAPIPEAEVHVSDVISAVRDYLTPRLLVATRLHVVKPFYVELTVKTTIVLKPDQKTETAEDIENVENQVRAEIDQFFSPYPDPARNTPGWPWGRGAFTSEVYAMLNQLPFIDYVTAVELSANFPDRELPNKAGVEVKPYELVKVAQVNVVIGN